MTSRSRPSQSTRRAWTSADTRTLRRLASQGKTLKQIGQSMRRDRRHVAQRARMLGIDVTRMVLRKRWTSRQDELIRALFADTATTLLAKRLRRPYTQVAQRAHSLGIHKSEAYMQRLADINAERGRTDARLRANQFPKGHVPRNKGLRRPGFAPGRMASTQFKKGELTGAARHNWRPIGTIVLDAEGYLKKKVSDDRTVPSRFNWRYLHVMLWEEHLGPVPPGHIITFKNRDKSDVRIDNLRCIGLRQNMQRNSYHNNYPPELRQLIHLRRALNRQINKAKRTSQ